MTDSIAKSARSRIEGGVDAVVIGANADGLVAAAYLGRAGLKTVLLERSGELGLPYRQSVLGGEAGMTDGAHLLHSLDARVIDDLDLYRHGVEFAARRLDTEYYFDDGERLFVGGDLRSAVHEFDDEAEKFPSFIEDTFEAAAALRPLLAGPPDAAIELLSAIKNLPAGIPERIGEMLTNSAEQVLDHYKLRGRMRTAMMAEAVFRSGLAPHEAMSFSALLARWSGEIAGLQGAIAFPVGGVSAVMDALRRAAQKAKVDIRASTEVEKILIEKDCAAGVVLTDGGQLRAPIVISALDANTTYDNMIGAASLDVTFQHALSLSPSKITTAQLQLVLENEAALAGDEMDPMRRLVYAPDPAEIRCAFTMAANGEAPDTFVIEAIYASVFDHTKDDDKQYVSVFAHPAPAQKIPDTDFRNALRDAIVNTFEKLAPGVAGRIAEEKLILASDLGGAAGGAHALYGQEGVLRQLGRAATASSAGGVGGLYFCGPETQFGAGINGAAGRNAAKAALGKAKKAGAAP